MNRLILDHLRRWSLLWLFIGIANGFCIGAFIDELKKIQGLTIQLILWIGALQLSMDLQKGISRVQATLPLTTRQIGRAWWTFSVGLPVLLMAITSGIGLMIHSAHTGRAFPLNAYAMNFASNTIFLGAMFPFIIGELPMWPQNLLGWVRRLFSVVILMAIFFPNVTFVKPLEIFVFIAALTMTVIGWFRAEQMVVQRATFRLGTQTGKRQTGQHHVPSGFGGLPYLWQTMALKIVYMAVAVAVWLVIMHLFLPGTTKMSPQRFLSALMPAFCSFGFFGLFMGWLMPILMRLRHLRSLPISTATIAAMMTLAPSALVCLIGLGWSIFNETGIQVPTGFVAYAAAFSLGAPMLVWQGLKMGMYALFFVVMIAIGFSGIIFIKGTSSTPLLIISLISLAAIVASFEITRRLLKSSSKPYRPISLPATGWGAWR